MQSRFHGKHITHRTNFIDQPKNRPMGSGMDLYAMKKEGTEFPVEVSLSSYNRNGDKFIIAFLSEISIRKKSEMEIKKLNDELEELKEGQHIHYQHEGSSEVNLDPGLLKHIIMNLVSNASKFSPGLSDIDVSTLLTGSEIILSVRDHGIGISKQDQEHLTERFFRGTNATNIQGTGLGLHLVAKYAELMQGSVNCKSEPGEGTEFTITFNKTSQV